MPATALTLSTMATDSTFIPGTAVDHSCMLALLIEPEKYWHAFGERNLRNVLHA